MTSGHPDCVIGCSPPRKTPPKNPATTTNYRLINANSHASSSVASSPTVGELKE